VLSYSFFMITTVCVSVNVYALFSKVPVLFELPVDVTTVADLDDHHHEILILYFVDDAVCTLANPISLKGTGGREFTGRHRGLNARAGTGA
jgi:hypothetical protein